MCDVREAGITAAREVRKRIGNLGNLWHETVRGRSKGREKKTLAAVCRSLTCTVSNFLPSTCSLVIDIRYPVPRL